MFCHYGSRERNHCHTQQQQQVQREKNVITFPDMAEHAVMVDPHDPDVGEARDKGQVRWPLPAQLVGQAALRLGGDLDFKDQQCDGDREYGVRKCLDASGLRLHNGSALGSSQSGICLGKVLQ